MVKFSPALLVFTTLALSVFASPIEHRDIIKVEADLQQVGRDIADLDALVTRLTAPLPLHDALALRAWVEKAGDDIDITTKDVQGAGSVSESDAGAILGEVNGSISNILKLLRDIDDKKDVLFSLNIPGAANIIRGALGRMHGQSTGLSNALINAAPPNDKAKATDMKNVVETQFLKLLNDFNH